MRWKPVVVAMMLGTALHLGSERAAAQPATPDLRTLLASTPAESLIAPLRRLEADRARPAENAEAAMTLGHLHFARGEYREAAAAFARAAARLDPTRKPEARYWAGLSWLGLGEPVQARAALEEVSSVPGPRRIDAMLGIAQAWELARRPERALELLMPLLDTELSESGPAVLERIATLAERASRPEVARSARARLLRDYPRSIEAASARLSLASATQATGTGAWTVVVGSFVDPARARSLASEAKRAGFPEAQVVVRGEGLAAIHIVRLGTYATSSEARKAGELATRAMGVAFEIVRAP